MQITPDLYKLVHQFNLGLNIMGSMADHYLLHHWPAGQTKLDFSSITFGDGLCVTVDILWVLL